jgi:hypothetical protein
MPTDVSRVMLPSMTSLEEKNLNCNSLFPRKSHFLTECHSVIPLVTSLVAKLLISTQEKTSAILFCMRLCLPSTRKESFFFLLKFSKNSSSKCYFGYNFCIRFLQKQVSLKCVLFVIRCKVSPCHLVFLCLKAKVDMVSKIPSCHYMLLV